MLAPHFDIMRIVVAVPLLLAGCASLLESEPVSTYPLRASGGPSVQVATSLPESQRVAVAVERPVAAGAIASDRLVVEVGDQLRFVSGARWEDDLPTLVAADIGRALLATEGVQVVDAAQRAGRADFGLITIIERMQVELGDDYTGRAVTEIVARLVRLPAREIVATSVFRAEAPAADDAPDTLAQAISTATQQTLRELADWVAEQTR
jgi:ABC-type uncharacterized transport system auxiliary subunit